MMAEIAETPVSLSLPRISLFRCSYNDELGLIGNWQWFQVFDQQSLEGKNEHMRLGKEIIVNHEFINRIKHAKGLEL